MGPHGVTFLAFVFLVPFLGVAIAADRKDCLMKLGHHGNLECCKDVHPERENRRKYFDPTECSQPPNKPPPSCDIEKCIAKKHGHLNDDGSMNMEAIQSDLEEKMAYNPEVVEFVKTKCINGELTDYGPPDICDLMKFRHCLRVQVALSCKEWDDAGPCSGMKDQIEESRSVV